MNYQNRPDRAVKNKKNMKSIKSLAAAAGLGALAILGVTGCAGPRYYAATPEEQMEESSIATQQNWVDKDDFASLSSNKAWPDSAAFHSERQ